MRGMTYLFLLLLLAIPCTAATIIVDWDGSGDYTTIQAGINAATNGDTVIVLEGRYTGSGNRDLDFGGRAITLRSLDPQDPCVVAATVIDGQNVYGQRGFIFHSGETSSSVVAGLTITNCNLEESDWGAGMYIENSSPTVTNCVFEDNEISSIGYGGGMGNYNSSPVVTQCVFRNNDLGSYGHGGGMYNYNSNPVVTDCTFTGNSGIVLESSEGGGMYNYNSSPVVTGCTFNGNWVDIGGGMYNSGSNPTITNCVFSSNVAFDRGGGIYNSNSSGTVNNCQFLNNRGQSGGGISGGGMVVRNCTFSDNEAVYFGGGMFAGSAVVTNCMFNGNEAEFGGGMCAGSGTSTVTNCTFRGNTALINTGAQGWGGGMYILGSGSRTVTDCIFWGNIEEGGATGELAQIRGGTPSVSYSCIQGLSGFTGNGNIGDNPLFVSGPLGDYYLSQAAAGQDSNSPCIDAGSDTAENLGMDESTTRTDGIWDDNTVDMGYHYPRNIADLYYDGYVNLDDVLIMTLQWLDTPGIPSADIAPDPLDNFVDYQDFGVIQQNWQWPQ